ncbi:MAG: hypothetical protein JWP92_1944, partial [Caulobacter sp.]|nr:hypothetical protein [Caulobacter sp.]
MRRPALWLAAAAVLLCGAGPTPKQAVAQLDVNHPKYNSPECAKAREAALDNKKHPIIGTLVKVGGNIAAPFAGTAVSLGMNQRMKAKRDKLAKKVAVNCVPDPLGADKSDVVMIAAPPAVP